MSRILERVDVTVVHLARKQNGVTPLNRFIDSYRRLDAGSPHALRIIAKGFESRADIADASERIGRPHTIQIVSDSGMDIGAYLASAATISTEFVCFLNSFSEILSASWLAILLSIAGRPGVGIVGATGSYESASSFVLSGMRTNWGFTIRHPETYVSTARELWRYGSRFSRFPNPHLRTNAFLMRTSLFRQMSVRGPDKLAALEFESGYRSLTRSLMRRGLRPMVAGADGRGFGLDEWPASATFRSLDQANLIVHDNQTRRYRDAASGERELLGRLAWGDRFTR